MRDKEWDVIVAPSIAQRRDRWRLVGNTMFPAVCTLMFFSIHAESLRSAVVLAVLGGVCGGVAVVSHVWAEHLDALFQEARGSLGARGATPITDHPWRQRFLYEGGELVADGRRCGHIVNPNFNSPASDADYCNRPPGSHEWVK